MGAYLSPTANLNQLTQLALVFSRYHRDVTGNTDKATQHRQTAYELQQQAAVAAQKFALPGLPVLETIVKKEDF